VIMAESTRAASGRIFVNYRREETAYAAGWLYDRLAERFGDGQVFKDVDSIELGDDFAERINYAVGSCDVLLALIGDRWLTITGADGRRRLDNPEDFVRAEIEAALARNVLVVPILVAGARMPDADLPPSLAKLVRRQALELSPSRFDSDLSRLLRVLDSTLAEAQPPPAAQQSEAAALALWTERDPGTRHMGPSRDLIYQLVSELSLLGKGNNFLVIERQDRRESFAQAARTGQNDYVVDYRDGDAAKHFTAAHLTMHQAQAALSGWAFNLPEWQDRFTWTRIPLGDTAAQAGRSGGPGTPPPAPATLDGTQPPQNLLLPPGKQRRRLSSRSRIIAGAGGIAAILLIVVIAVASGPTTTGGSSSGSATPLPTSLLPAGATIVQDNFSSRAYGWLDSSAKSGSVHYYNGAYRILNRTPYRPIWSYPAKASVYPSAPPNIRIKVVAHIIFGPPQNSSAYGIVCRADPTNGTAYVFVVSETYVAIYKSSSGSNISHNGRILDSRVRSSAVPLKANNLLQAQCTNEGQRGVHLVFSVNGRIAAAATDTNNPLLTGTVGLTVLQPKYVNRPVEAEFDNFVVSRV
jgi:TIR domain